MEQEQKLTQINQYPEEIDSLATLHLPDIVNENPQKYIFVPQKKIVIATKQTHNNVLREDAISALQKGGLRHAPIDAFMQHYLNLREAAAGRKQLFYANGDPINRVQAIRNWNYLSSTDRSPFGNAKLWIWLDAHFKETPEGLQMQTGHKCNNGKLEGHLVKLDPFASEFDWADLDLNAQGLPKKNNGSEYIQGQNKCFLPPSDDSLTWFIADKSRAGLVCIEKERYDHIHMQLYARREKHENLGVLTCT